ncbi:MAG: YopX family protein [Candidatus Hodarchaeales archaeon]
MGNMEHKYKAWDRVNKCFIEIGDLNDFIWDSNHISFSIGKNCDLILYTGFKDKDDVEIYDKDIVMDGMGQTGQIKWCGGIFWLGTTQLFDVITPLTVIGSGYKNPEMLEGNINE